jgi:cephalosporin-C deacetylase-like acetyl esterase
MKFQIRSAVLTALLLAAMGPASRAADLSQILSYDASVPLDVKVVGTEKRPEVTVQDITFRSVAGGAPVQAYVVRPSEGSGPFAGVLFVHWFAPSFATSNRTQYLSEAEELARRGTVSLLVSTFWSDPARYRGRRWEDDYQNTVDQAKELRRALDVLLAQPGVDKGRIGYVGHDYGAMFGALVAAVDPRPKAYVMIAGTARFTDWYLFGSTSGVPAGEALASFKERLAPLEPVNAMTQAKAAVFYQFGESDRFTPREDFIALYMATPATKRIATYASDHPMGAEIIRHDRIVWLAEQLGLPGA